MMILKNSILCIAACASCAVLGGVAAPRASAQTAEAKSAVVSGTEEVPVTPGVSRLDGTVLAVLSERGEIVLRVSRIRDQNGHVTVLSPPRAKPVILRQLDEEVPLSVGDQVQVTGRDMGRGRPLRASALTLGSGTEADEAEGVVAGGEAVTPLPAPPAHTVVKKVTTPTPATVKRSGALASRGRFDRAALARAKRKATGGAASSASIVLPDGTRVEGRRLLTLQATGYGPQDNGPWGDRTKVGTTVGYGTVAVDPRIIPLGTRLWVEGYGFCIALDIGSAIKGYRIDLGHDNEEDAEMVGRKKVKVLILN